MNISKIHRQHQKLVEELLELATVITQQLNKPKKDYYKEIKGEIKDVEKRLSQIKKYYNKEKNKKK